MPKRQRIDDSQAYSVSQLSQGSTATARRRRGYKLRVSRMLRGPTPYNYVYPFERVVDVDAALNLNSGWGAQAGGVAGNGLGLGFAFTLDNVRTEYSNGSTFDTAINGASDFQNLFDQWKIERVDMIAYFNQTNQTLQPNTVNTYTMPIIRLVTDYDNTDVSTTEPVTEYPQCRTYQTGMSRSIKHTVYYPGVNIDAQIDTNPSLPAMVKRSPWLDTATPEVAHYGIKVFYVPFNLSSPDYSPDVIVGAMKFTFKIYYSMKLAR